MILLSSLGRSQMAAVFRSGSGSDPVGSGGARRLGSGRLASQAGRPVPSADRQPAPIGRGQGEAARLGSAERAVRLVSSGDAPEVVRPRASVADW